MKRLCDYRYSATEAKMIIGTPRSKLHETYREASAAVILYQQENCELEDSYLIEVLQGRDPAGIFSKDTREKPEKPIARALTDIELERRWQELDVSLKTLGQMYLSGGVVKSHPKIIVEAVGFLLSETTMLRQEPSLTISGLAASHERAKMLTKQGINALQSYTKSGKYAISIHEPHLSEGGSNFFDVRYLEEGDKRELILIEEARLKAKHEGVAQFTRQPLPDDGSHVETGPARCQFGNCEIRTAGGKRGQGKKHILATIPFNSPSAVLYDAKHGSFVEILEPFCFREALEKGTEIISLWSHDVRKPLGSTKNGTLEIWETEAGLHYRLYMNMATSYGRDAFESVSRGDCHSTSFMFSVEPPDGEEHWPPETLKGYPIRSIVRVSTLAEVSPTVMAAYEHSAATAAGGE